MCGVIFIQDEDASGGDQDQEERRWNKRTQQMLHGLQVCHHGLTLHSKGLWDYAFRTIVICCRTRKPAFETSRTTILKYFNTCTVRPRISLEGIQVSAFPWFISHSRVVVAMCGALLWICILLLVEQIYLQESLNLSNCCSVRCHLPWALDIDEIP